MRLFVAISVGDEVRAAAARVRSGIDGSLQHLKAEPPRIVWVAPQGLHLTLRFLGEQPDDRVAGLVEAVQEPFPFAPFEVIWHGLGAFPTPKHPRAIWLGVKAGARQLGQIEVEVSRRIGGLLPGEHPADAKPFHPHLTIARVKTEARGVDWSAILAAAAIRDVTSRVTHVSLFRSRGLPGGTGYEEIGSGRLDG